MKHWLKRLTVLAVGLSFLFLSTSRARAQDPDESIDPHDFFDATDEPADEAFFHLERFFQVGMLGGIGLFTGGLGSTHGLGGALGFNVIYFFDNAFAFEFGVLFSFQENALTGLDTAVASTQIEEESTTWIYLPNFNFRYYFPTTKLSRFLAGVNPYLVGGIDWVIRSEKISRSMSGSTPTARQGQKITSNNVGFNLGLGISSLVYGASVDLGLDIRFRYWILSGEQDNTQGFSRAGDYLTFLATLTYNY